MLSSKKRVTIIIKNNKKKITMKNNNNPTTMIKCRFSNDVHKLLEPNLNVKASERWKHRDKYKLSDDQKLEIFDKIIELHSQCSNEIQNYLHKKRKKRRVQKERIERGYVPKKKTKKEDYEKSLFISK